MTTTQEIQINVTPQNPESRWVTIDNSGQLVSEAETPERAIELANSKSTECFSVLFVPQAGNTYIF